MIDPWAITASEGIDTKEADEGASNNEGEKLNREGEVEE